MSAFTEVQRETIEEIETEAILYRHNRTGALVLSLLADDDNNVFGAAFRTPPSDSTGVAHILEHSVLCGSRKYRMKEPFKELLKSSLYTFLNAMTYPDFTLYPVSSTHSSDFYNLVDVYLDAVFFPRLTPQIFQQEGWRVAWDDAQQKASFQGVVYNEMKGNYSAADNVAYEHARSFMYQGSAYEHDSGGNPPQILDLSFEGLKAFHDTYYHPANSLLFFYGNSDPERRLSMIDTVLAPFSSCPTPSLETGTPSLKAPAKARFLYHASEQQKEQDEHYFTRHWLLPASPDKQTVLRWTILDKLLLDTPASPLRVALMESGLGDEIAGSGFDIHYNPPSFSTGMQGVTADNIDALDNLIQETLRHIASKGFDPDLVESVFNAQAFRIQENSSGNSPRGLGYFLRAVRGWKSENNPIFYLHYQDELHQFREAVDQNPDILGEMIQTLILDNPVQAGITVAPDTSVNQNAESQEQHRLESTLAELDIEKLKEENRALQTWQNTPDTPEVLASIPVLKVSDLPQKVSTIPKETIQTDGGELLYRALPARGIVYTDLVLNLDHLTEKELLLLPLYTRWLTEGNTQQHTYQELSREIGKHTGGISSNLFHTTHEQSGASSLWLSLRGKALEEKQPVLLSLFKEILTQPDFADPERLRQLVQEDCALMESSMISSGHAWVKDRLLAPYSLETYQKELLHGVPQLAFLRKVPPPESLIPQLQLLHQRILRHSKRTLNLTASAASLGPCIPEATQWLNQLPATTPCPPHVHKVPEFPEQELLGVPGNVHFVGQVWQIETEELKPGTLYAIQRHVRSDFLWDEIRVKGGAYGCPAGYSRHHNLIHACSYRDPHIQQTLEVYQRIPEWLRETASDADAIQQNLIGVYRELEPHREVRSKGYASLLRHLTGTQDQLRQDILDQAMGTTSKAYFSLASSWETAQQTARTVVLTDPANKTALPNATHIPLL